MAKRANNKYSPEFKKKAVEKYLSGEIGGVKLASRALGLRSSTQLRQWVKLYRENPELLNEDNRGKAPAKEGVHRGRPKKINLEELSLEEQIEHLKMENAVLKKAKALRKDYGEH